MNPEYEMAFYAKINRAMAYQKGASNIAEIKEELEKMLNDQKNKEYYDQIYFALGDLALKQGNKLEGISYLEKAAEQESINLKQKTKTHLKLANLYFNDKDYINAQAKYDSSVTYMDKNREDYLEILDLRNGLTRIVKDIKIIEKEDSLQHLATLPQKEVDKIIGNIIDNIIAEEERAKQEVLNSQQALLNQGPNQQNSAGGWYFYNPSTVNFGKAEFRKKWGDRKLEDNWRRKDKTSGAQFFDDVELEQIEENDTLASANDLKSPSYYIKNIPNTPIKMTKSHNLIIEALYDLGVQYKEQLNEDVEAIKTFEDLLARYDTSKYHLNSYYQLYRLYTNHNNNSKADYYKNLIVGNYPNSNYAALLTNPNYYNDVKKEEQALNLAYENAYKSYLSRDYDNVIFSCNKALGNFIENNLSSKFLYLKGLCYSSINDTVNLKVNLTQLAEQYAETEEGKLAKYALERLNSDNSALNESTAETSSPYTFKADEKHNFILILPTSIIADNEVKNAISDFNKKYYGKSALKISSVLFGNDKRMYVVKPFNNLFSAKDYYNSFSENEEELKKINSTKYSCFSISLSNYPIFYKEKDIEGYETFFDLKYK